MGGIGREVVNRLIWGLFLIVIGATLLAVNLGWDLPHGAWNYWPFLLIAMGTAKMLFGGEREGCGSGFWLVLGGLYGWISIWHVWGLDWGTAWPIFVIAGGLSVILKPAFSRRGRFTDRAGSGGDRPNAPGVDHVG